MCDLDNIRRTKIICTIGPASEKPEVLKQMMLAGMNVARFNMSHGSYEDHARRISAVRSVAKELKMAVSCLLDTKGPEVRTGEFKNGKIEVKDGAEFTFCCDQCIGDETKAFCNYPNLYQDLKPGQCILVNDGLVSFKVKKIEGHNIICDCVKGGFISNRKSMNFPNLNLGMAYLSDVDREDILFGIKQDVDYVACSFVSCRDNVQDVRNLLDVNGGERIDIIAKIENRSGVDNADDILNVANGIMVARGDMGVEIPFHELPGIQKGLVNLCRHRARKVIVATEMLESMIEKPRPTRAETSDVANAVYDGASAIMLSGESAAGKYPVECVKTMSNIAREAESRIDFHERLVNLDFKIHTVADAISHATVEAAYQINAKLILVFSKSGRTARSVSRFRPTCPVIAVTNEIETYTQLAMNWGMLPYLVPSLKHPDELFSLADKIAREYGCTTGDNIAVTVGVPMTSTANMLKIVTLK